MAECSIVPWPDGYAPFHPRPWLRNGHLQTISGNFLRRRNELPQPVAQLVEVSPGHGTQISTQLLCECHWQPLPERSTRPTQRFLPIRTRWDRATILPWAMGRR